MLRRVSAGYNVLSVCHSGHVEELVNAEHVCILCIHNP